MKKRILFVDDARHILNSLRLSLRGMSDTWDVVFALGGEEAVGILQRSRFDLMVTDIRMPGIDGSHLLDLACREYPSMGRVVLSGYSEGDCVLKNIPLAHQYLSKPCTTEELLSTISNALTRGDTLDNDRMKEIVSNLKSLPALPAVYGELVAALENRDTSWKEVCAILNKDMALVATVLRVANCAVFGLCGKVTSLDHAVKLLGMQTLRTLVLSTHLFSMFDQRTMPAFSVSRLWNHSIRVSNFAKIIATNEHMPSSFIEDCNIAGMLHDIGKVILSVMIPEEFKKVIEIVKTENITVHEAEKELLNTTHADVGSYLMGLWGFSDTQIETVRFHHTEIQNHSNSATIQSIIYASNILDHELVCINTSFKSKRDDLNKENIHKTNINYNSWMSACSEKIENDKNDEIKSILYA